MWNGDQPIVVTVVESAEVVERILPELRSLVPDAMIAISDVRMLRIQRSVA
jgi:PII-like signaling protein